MTSLEKLDAVLDLIRRHSLGKLRFDFSEISNRINEENIDIEFGEIVYILKKLLNDGYIMEDDRFDKTKFGHDTVYRINFEGRLFLEQGGYEGVNTRQNVGNIRVANLENHQKRHRMWMTRLTIILAAGTTLAAIYYCVELYWKYHWFH